MSANVCQISVVYFYKASHKIRFGQGFLAKIVLYFIYAYEFGRKYDYSVANLTLWTLSTLFLS